MQAMPAVDTGQSLEAASQEWGVPLATIQHHTIRDASQRRRSARDASTLSYYVGPKKRKSKDTPGAAKGDYTVDDLNHALGDVAKGDRLMTVSRRYGIPESTIRSKLFTSTAAKSTAAVMPSGQAQSSVTAPVTTQAPVPKPVEPPTKAKRSPSTTSKAPLPKYQPSRSYTDEDMAAALDMILKGAKIKTTSREMGIPFTSLYTHVRRYRKNVLSTHGLPRKPPEGDSKRKYTDKDLALALDAIAGGKRMLTVAFETDIPVSTLHGRLKRDEKIHAALGLGSKPPEPRLSFLQEYYTAEWAKAENSSARPPTATQVIAFAQSALDHAGGIGTMGSNWLQVFMRRNPSVKIRGAASVDGWDESVTVDDDVNNDGEDATDEMTLVNGDSADEEDDDDHKLSVIRHCVDLVVAEYESDAWRSNNAAQQGV